MTPYRYLWDDFCWDRWRSWKTVCPTDYGYNDAHATPREMLRAKQIELKKEKNRIDRLLLEIDEALLDE
jgi:hypothetical protein